MFFQASLEPVTIDLNVLKKFVSSCHRKYLRKYNLIGHHNLGWGFAYIPEGTNNMVIKRDLTPIYKADWRELSKIKTRFLLVHARKAYPWLKNKNNIHPIDVRKKYLITHNGTIKNDSFPKLDDSELEQSKNSTSLDTRKYLCSIIDGIQKGSELKEVLQNLFQRIKIGIAANAFIFSANECNIVNYHHTKFNGRHRTLFLSRKAGTILVATTPLRSDLKEIANHSLINLNLTTLDLNFEKLIINGIN